MQVETLAQLVDRTRRFPRDHTIRSKLGYGAEVGRAVLDISLAVLTLLLDNDTVAAETAEDIAATILSRHAAGASVDQYFDGIFGQILQFSRSYPGTIIR